jgi:hypothetical protein
MTVRIKKPKNLHSAFSRARADAVKHKIAFKGDERSGSGSGYGFAGSYRVYSDFIEIVVEKKPVFVTRERIKREIVKYCERF